MIVVDITSGQLRDPMKTMTGFCKVHDALVCGDFCILCLRDNKLATLQKKRDYYRRNANIIRRNARQHMRKIRHPDWNPSEETWNQHRRRHLK